MTRYKLPPSQTALLIDGEVYTHIATTEDGYIMPSGIGELSRARISFEEAEERSVVDIRGRKQIKTKRKAKNETEPVRDTDVDSDDI